LGPRTVKVYVVVTAGFSCRVPRGVTRPGSGSIVTLAGFSVCHTSMNDCPGRREAGSAVKRTMRAGMSLALV
jgi:hypothetical protein